MMWLSISPAKRMARIPPTVPTTVHMRRRSCVLARCSVLCCSSFEMRSPWPSIFTPKRTTSALSALLPSWLLISPSTASCLSRCPRISVFRSAKTSLADQESEAVSVISLCRLCDPDHHDSTIRTTLDDHHRFACCICEGYLSDDGGTSASENGR